MSIILSCGHREDDFDNHHSIMTKEWDITEDGWVKAVGYKVVCLSCYNEYAKRGDLLMDEAAAMKWIRE
jgi:hypothetical protein